MRKIELVSIDRQSFVQRYGPWAVIAGASDGAGACFAEQLAEMRINVVLVSRRQEVLDALGSRLATAYAVQYRAVKVDLMQEGAGARILEATADLDVGLYVSNAGIDGSGNSFLDSPVSRSQSLLTMNARTLIDVVHGFGLRMRDRGGGGIIIMSSGSGLGGQPWLVMYSSTKAFEINFAESLWAELGPSHIDVLGALAPGMDTPSLRRAIAGKKMDLSQVYDPGEVVHNILAHLGKNPLLIFPDGPEAARIPQIEAERRQRLVTMAEWAKRYTD